MLKHLIGPGCALAALLATPPGVTAMPAFRPAASAPPAVEQVALRHGVRHRRRLTRRQQLEPQTTEQVPTGGGEYGGPDSAFPEGENSAVRPGGSYAVTAPIGTPAHEIQSQQQERFCRDNPEVC